MILSTEIGKIEKRVRLGEAGLDMFVWRCPLNTQKEIFNI